MKREALEVLGLIVLFACLIAAVWLTPPRVGDGWWVTRSGHGDLPDEGSLPGQVMPTPVPTYRPYDPSR